ncbi:MaoC family dehydratase N-terminal domain-containing protein [Rhodococcus sp. NPDC059968]|uniref:FAS1-like dehydratase domain-containing protein n=1 Tax=Rhodococcus sp. NPDC059968 TaxID=3347017 RepID=UPI00366B7B60
MVQAQVQDVRTEMIRMVTSYVTPEMEGAVGQVYERLVSFPVSESDIRRWAIAVYYPDPPPRQFWDGEFAAGTRHGGIVAPHEFNPFAWMTAVPERRPALIDAEAIHQSETLLGIEPPPLNQGLNGGLEVEYHKRIRPGDVITSEAKLVSYNEREGKLGHMLISRTEATWTNQRAELVKRSYFTLIRY